MVTLDQRVETYVLPSALVFTDEALHYQQLGRKGYKHKRIKHSAKVYVKGDAHAQTIEGFWSLLKRGISGVYHSVGADYLQSYIDEYSWRYNHRSDGRSMFRELLSKPPLSRRPRSAGTANARLPANSFSE